MGPLGHSPSKMTKRPISTTIAKRMYILPKARSSDKDYGPKAELVGQGYLLPFRVPQNDARYCLVTLSAPHHREDRRSLRVSP